MGFDSGSGGGGGGSGFFEQVVELVELGAGHVAELLVVDLEDGLVELVQQVAADVGDADAGDAAVVVGPGPDDQVGVDEAVDEPGDVGHAGDEPAADFEAGQALGVFVVLGAAEDAQDVVGGLGQAVLFEEVVEIGRELARGADEVEIGLLALGVEGLVLLDFFLEAVGGHATGWDEMSEDGREAGRSRRVIVDAAGTGIESVDCGGGWGRVLACVGGAVG